MSCVLAGHLLYYTNEYRKQHVIWDVGRNWRTIRTKGNPYKLKENEQNTTVYETTMVVPTPTVFWVTFA